MATIVAILRRARHVPISRRQHDGRLRLYFVILMGAAALWIGYGYLFIEAIINQTSH